MAIRRKRKPANTNTTTALTPPDTRWRRRRWQIPFIAALRNSANIRYACEEAGVTRQSAYEYREKHAKFRAQWDEALDDACDILEGMAWKRSEGSDQLLMFLLKAHRPDKFRERHEIMGRDGGAIPLVVQAIDYSKSIAPLKPDDASDE
jgi:hypothetical protein